MRVLGIFMNQDSGAAVVEDGRLLAAVNEERLSRVKLVSGFPRGSIQQVLKLSGTKASELDGVVVGETTGVFADELRPFHPPFTRPGSGYVNLIKRNASALSRFRDKVPGLEQLYYALLTPAEFHRRYSVPPIIREEFGIRCPTRFVDHHLAHATSAYFTSGHRDALVVTLDGGGDRKSSRIYAVRDGRFQELHSTPAYHSLGAWYAYVTHLCGFMPHKHEGKITGLAAFGKPRYVSILRNLIDVHDGVITNRSSAVGSAAALKLHALLPDGWTREDLSASIQAHVEDVCRRYIRYWLRESGLRNLVLAGGVHANVRVNEELHDMAEVDATFIHPHMGDGGLAAGAALAACIPGVLPRTMTRDQEPLRDVYLGPDLGEREIFAALRARDLAPVSANGDTGEFIASLLADGYVVARAAGRMEYGPRALGNRSILYQPTDRGVNDWLNENLRRTEFMPFAPSVLYEARDRCFEKISGAEHAAEFMTMTFPCTGWMRAVMPGVVHIDGTARPQLVRKERNPEYHSIIRSFLRRTGLPAVINTSFNMHEEPIVCSADDAVRAFLDGNLDYLALGSQVVRHPRGIARRVTPVRGAQNGEMAV